MKLVFFDDFKLGVIRDNQVVDVRGAVSGITHSSPQDLINKIIADFDKYRGDIQNAADSGSGISVDQVRLRSPMPKPGNIVCMAVNYMEDGTRSEPAPINAFHKSPNSVIGNRDTLVLPDAPATIFEGEAEMALIIGKHASNVKPENAYEHIFGYMGFIDGSARGLPPAGNTFYQMKSRDTFAPMGPWLVTADEIDDPLNLSVKLWVNEELKQTYNTSDMAHKIPRIIEWVTSIHDLEPGDVVATGTNHRGLSAFQDGDRINLEVQGLGNLNFGVRDDQKRTWDRTTRLEMAEQGKEGTTPQLSGMYSG